MRRLEGKVGGTGEGTTARDGNRRIRLGGQAATPTGQPPIRGSHPLYRSFPKTPVQWAFVKAREDRSLDRFLELLGRAERNLLARLDLDGFAGRRVAAHARGALAHLQHAEAHQPDLVLEDLGGVRAQPGAVYGVIIFSVICLLSFFILEWLTTFDQVVSVLLAIGAGVLAEIIYYKYRQRKEST